MGHNRIRRQRETFAYRLAAEFDPREVTDRIGGEFRDWASQNEHRLHPTTPYPPHRDWRNIEMFLKDNYPAAHKGFSKGQEQAGVMLDYPQKGKRYKTGPRTQEALGYDPKEIAAGALYLHNSSHPFRMEWSNDLDRLTRIYDNRQQMQRNYEQRQANSIYRFASDQCSGSGRASKKEHDGRRVECDVCGKTVRITPYAAMYKHQQRQANRNRGDHTHATLYRLQGEFTDWWNDLESDNQYWSPPFHDWNKIEGFLKDYYPEAYRGLDMGMEHAQPLLDQQTGHFGDPVPKRYAPYETGPDAVAKHGYDPKETVAGMLLLHNEAHGYRDDLAQMDHDRLYDIAQKRYQMQRNYEQRQANSRIAMTKRKPVYFALNPQYPGHAMAYWGDRYEPIAEVKWQTKGLPGYGEDWEPSPEEQGSINWVWSHPHARHKGITKNLLEWVRDNHEPNLHGSKSMTPQGKALSEALGHHVDDADWNRLQPVRGYERPINDAPYRMVDEGRDEWEANGRPDNYI